MGLEKKKCVEKQIREEQAARDAQIKQRVFPHKCT